MEYHLAIALNKLELYVSAQINLKNIMLSKKYLVWKDKYFMIYYV